MSHIVSLAQARPQATLENLRRLTGLEFHRLPESLLTDGPVCGGQAAGKKKPVGRTGARRTGNVCSLR